MIIDKDLKWNIHIEYATKKLANAARMLCKIISLLNDIFKLEMGKFVHSFYHQNLPDNFKNYFSSANNQHSYTTRSLTNKNYFIERVNTKYGLSTCAYIGAEIWNNIPSEIKNMSRYGFNKRFKKQIVSSY